MNSQMTMTKRWDDRSCQAKTTNDERLLSANQNSGEIEPSQRRRNALFQVNSGSNTARNWTPSLTTVSTTADYETTTWNVHFDITHQWPVQWKRTLGIANHQNVANNVSQRWAAYRPFWRRSNRHEARTSHVTRREMCPSIWPRSGLKIIASSDQWRVWVVRTSNRVDSCVVLILMKLLSWRYIAKVWSQEIWVIRCQPRGLRLRSNLTHHSAERVRKHCMNVFWSDTRK